jgi:hypothetical protein
VRQLVAIYVAIWRIQLARVCFRLGSKFAMLGQRLMDRR